MRLAGGLAMAAALLFCVYAQLAGGLNPDVSWLLTVCQRMLAGQQLYTDISELNPPMSALLYLPFVGLAQVLRVPAEPVVIGAVLLVCLLSLGVSGAMLWRARLLPDIGMWWLISIAALTILPGGNFGEREHIAVILLLPVLAASALRSTGTAPGPAGMALAGVAAGLVMTIKPHFALPILFIALWSAHGARSWRPVFNPENLLAGAVLIAYWLAVWTWFPSFFSTMLPIASAAYLADRMGLPDLLLGLPVLSVWLVAAVLVVLYRGEMLARPHGQSIAAAMGFFVVYLIQGKGFVYHLLPSQMLLAVVLAHSFARRNAHGPARVIPIALAVLLVAAPGVLAFRGNAVRNQALAILAPLGPGLRIANITSQLEIASPLHRDLGGTLVNSGPCLWVTLGAIRRQMLTDDAAVRREMAILEAGERIRLKQDMLAHTPDIILAGGDAFDWIAWARRDPDIDAMLAHYTLMATIGPKSMPLQIFRRQPG